MIYINLILVAFVVERTVEILVDSKLFAPLRSYIAKKAIPDLAVESQKPYFWWFCHSLSSCGYCMSVWVAGFYAVFFRIGIVEFSLMNWMINALLLHGLSNIIHVIYMIIYKGRVKYHHITYTKSTEDGL